MLARLALDAIIILQRTKQPRRMEHASAGELLASRVRFRGKGVWQAVGSDAAFHLFQQTDCRKLDADMLAQSVRGFLAYQPGDVAVLVTRAGRSDEIGSCPRYTVVAHLVRMGRRLGL